MYEDDGCVHIVQELCTGGSLQDVLDCAPTVDHSMVVRVARGMLSGLCACGDEHVVHGDLKPSNIMFATPDRLQVRLIDFGSSVLVGSDEASAACRFGTPAFTAPEVFRSGLCRLASDSWSAGVVLHMLLMGTRLPTDFVLCDASQAVARLEFAAYTPKAAKDLVKGLLQVDVARRLHPYEALGHPFFSM
jgi:serine/threonine protein kinase